MLDRSGRFVVLALVSVLVTYVVAGCRMIEPEPTPSPVEAVATSQAVVEEIVSAYPLASTAWELQFIGDPEERLPLLPNTRATVVYFWDRYTGFDGCGWFLGVYGADAEGVLRMNTPAKTPHYCAEPPGLETQASTYMSALLNVTEYEIAEEQLATYTVDDQRMLTFDPEKPVPILGPRWELKFWWHTEDERWLPVAPAVTSSITFAEGVEASGSGGCNEYSVSYEGDLQIEMVMASTPENSELPALTFGQIEAASAECSEPDGIMEQEAGFFALLEEVAYYFKMGGITMMMDANHEPLLIFAAAS
jgi:heat shock protein HslJ